jgi:hypothetical protein
MRRLAAAALFLLFGSAFLSSESVTMIRNNGPSSNRVDLVVLGDGYTAAEMDKFAADVETFVLAVFSVEPFKEYASYFNVLRVDVVSRESGADKPASGLYKATALDATYYCGQIQRTVCVSTSKVSDALSRSGVGADQRDMILVLVNDPEYGGSGGAVGVASTHPSCIELILHEEGHSFGLLADEYDTTPPTCVNGVEPSEPNATRVTDRTKIKWNAGGGPPTGWIDPVTAVPTIGLTTPGIPGLYEGARYCVSGLYRPTYNSLMRALSRNYEPINTEQLIKRIYNWVSGLEASSPAEANVSLASGETRTFQVATPKPASHDLDIAWTMDGVRVGAGPKHTVESSGRVFGSHELKAEVHDPTTRVRSDPAAALTDVRTWTVRGYFDFVALRLSADTGGTTDPAPGSYGRTAGNSTVIRAVPDEGYVFLAWTGNVPAGRETDNPLTLVMNAEVTLKATFRKALLPPLEASGKKVLNRSLSKAEYVNVISFAPNPASIGTTGYRIYRFDLGNRAPLANLDAKTFVFWDRKVLKSFEYTYTIVAFNAAGLESEPATVVVR